MAFHLYNLCNSSDGVIIWVESKGTKQQWQTTVTDINDHGPGLIPIEAIFCFLQVINKSIKYN